MEIFSAPAKTLQPKEKQETRFFSLLVHINQFGGSFAPIWLIVSPNLSPTPSQPPILSF